MSQPLEPLTPAQRRAFDFVTSFHAATGNWPTVREAAAALGYRSPNGFAAVAGPIARKGYWRRHPKRARSYQVLALPDGPAPEPPPGSTSREVAVGVTATGGGFALRLPRRPLSRAEAAGLVLRLAALLGRGES